MNDRSILIFDFNPNSNISNWRVVNDGVMGGVSEGNFIVNKNGYGEFTGFVFLENNGGFSSLQYSFPAKEVLGYSKIILRVKGDKKSYQFRVKDKVRNYYSYIYKFSTNGNWQTIEIPLQEMYAAFRGRKLDMNNFQSNTIEQIAFLIGNKKAEHFKLEIDAIYLQ